MSRWDAFKSVKGKTVSVTRLGDYDSCPALYHNRHERKTPEAEGIALSLGRLWNDLICGIKIKGVVPPTMERKYQKYLKRYPDPLLKANIQKAIMKPIPDTDRTLIGFIDYLDPSKVVVDFKFAMKPWTEKKATAFYTVRQMYSYCWAVGFDKYEFRIANMETDEIQVFSGTVTKRNISDTLRWMKRMIKGIDSGNRCAKSGPLCDYCGFRKECSLYEGMPSDTDTNIELEEDDYAID